MIRLSIYVNSKEKNREIIPNTYKFPLRYLPTIEVITVKACLHHNSAHKN